MEAKVKMVAQIMADQKFCVLLQNWNSNLFAQEFNKYIQNGHQANEHNSCVNYSNT
jgi:hypothetical protein